MKSLYMFLVISSLLTYVQVVVTNSVTCATQIPTELAHQSNPRTPGGGGHY